MHDVDSDHVICMEIEATLRAKCEVLQRQLAELRTRADVMSQALLPAWTLCDGLVAWEEKRRRKLAQDDYGVMCELIELARMIAAKLAELQDGGSLPKREPA